MSENNSNTFGEQRNESQTVDRRTYLKLAGAAGSGIGAGIGTGALGANFTAPVRAASVIEDFNYSSSSEMKSHYDFYFGQSNASLGSVSSTATSDASDSVLEITGGNTKMVAYDDGDGSDLTAYPQVGDTITCWIRGANATENVNVNYGAEDGDGRDDHYYVKVNMEKPGVGIGVVDDGDATWLQSAPEDPSFSANAWYRLEIQWNDGSPNTHDVTLYDQNGNSLASLTYDGTDSADPQHEGHGFGYSAYVGSSEAAEFDYATMNRSDSSSGNENYAIIDDFEDEGLSEYTHDPTRSGTASIVSSSNSPVYEGENALEISGENAELISKDGLNTYPAAGDRFSYWFQLTEGAINDVANVTYGVQNHENRYYVQLDFQDDRLRLAKLQNSTADWFDHTSASYQEGVWYELEVTWYENGDQRAVLYDESGNSIANVIGNDSTWTGGGVGYDGYVASSGGSIYFDYITKDGLNYEGTDPKTATRFDKVEKQYSVSENNYYQIASTVRCTGGYEKSGGMWGTTFRNSAYGVARRYEPSSETPEQGTNINVIDEHSISYTDTDDGNQSTFGYKYGEGYVGGWPTPEATDLEIAEATLEALFEETIGEISKYVNPIIVAKDVYQNVQEKINENESTTTGENREFIWWYGDGWTSDEHADICHFSEVDYEQEYDSVSTFHVESAMADGTVNPNVNWRVNVEAPTSEPSTSTASSSSTDRHSSQYSNETREKFGLRKVPIRDLKKTGIDLDNPRIVDGDKVWFATKPQVTFTPI